MCYRVRDIDSFGIVTVCHSSSKSDKIEHGQGHGEFNHTDMKQTKISHSAFEQGRECSGVR